MGSVVSKIVVSETFTPSGELLVVGLFSSDEVDYGVW